MSTAEPEEDFVAGARARVGELLARLGSSFENERLSAVELAGSALIEAGLSWSWLAELAAKGVVPADERSRLFEVFARDRLRAGLRSAWAMVGDEIPFVRDLEKASDLNTVDPHDLMRAVRICDEACRRAALAGPKTWVDQK